jgi:hypothetical protein
VHLHYPSMKPERRHNNHHCNWCSSSASTYISHHANGLWIECAFTVSFYEARRTTQQSPLQLMFIINKQTHQSPCKWCSIHHSMQLSISRPLEKGVLSRLKNHSRKVKWQRYCWLLVVYPQKYTDKVYRIFYLKSKQIIRSRDLI